MITITGKKNFGDFVYGDEKMNVNGHYEGYDDGTLIHIKAYFDDNSVTIDVDYDIVQITKQYTINGYDTEKIISATETINTIWNEVKIAVSDLVDSKEEEQSEQEEELK